jgi:DNA-binding NtrC family response regulator
MTKVIVVDDDPTNTGLIKMLLELDGFSVDACTDLDQARRAASPETIAFIIDCNLARGVSGMDLLEAVRQEGTEAPKDAVVIMTSGDQRRGKEAKSKGANEFLLKPYPPEILSVTLKQLVGKEGTGG